jgi:hypothetical protein
MTLADGVMDPFAPLAKDTARLKRVSHYKCRALQQRLAAISGEIEAAALEVGQHFSRRSDCRGFLSAGCMFVPNIIQQQGERTVCGVWCGR